MTTVPAAQTKGIRSTNRLLKGLLGWYVFLWVVLAIAPVDRRDWALENILAVLLVGILVATYRSFPFSDLSYILMTLFLTLHAIGAHYTYAEVPFGFSIKSLFELKRNHFDRVVHFAFGLLLTYPIRELLVRKSHVQGYWTYGIPVVTLLALSGFFEIIETWVAQVVSPELGDAYLGTQGDIWDAQKDMTAALSGSILSMALTAVWSGRRRGRAGAREDPPQKIVPPLGSRRAGFHRVELT
jgi:putative membrane protein